MEGVKAKQQKLDRYNELAMNYSDETTEEGAKLQDVIDAQNLKFLASDRLCSSTDGGLNMTCLDLTLFALARHMLTSCLDQDAILRS